MSRPCLVAVRDVGPVAETFSDLDVVQVPKDRYTTAELASRSAGANALFVHSENEYGADLFDALPGLEVVGKPGSGIDNIDTAAATARGITVTHTPGLNADSVGEFAVGMLVSLLRKLGPSERHLRDGGWRSPEWWGRELRGETVGLLGLGATGTATAERLRPFGPDLLAHDPYVDTTHADAAGVEFVGFDELFERSSVLSVHVRLTDETRGAIDADALSRLGTDGVVLNTARAEVIDRDALYDALREDRLAGAALDVFHDEPPAPDDPVFDVANVLTTPHLAGAGRLTRVEMLETTADSVVRLLSDASVDERLVANPETL
ncbi:MAG: lactate dehydrogenase related dehydrogenase [uncultured archaeon A07HB70]|nr:MAG: lactate dehydrogenase related dehydrogenase [uncultured archaeon A07HB70]